MSEKTEYSKVTPVSRVVLANETKEEEPKRLEPLLQTPPKQVKPSLFRRAALLLFGKEGVFKYIGREVLLPAIRDMAYDAVSNGAKKALYGDSSTVTVNNRRSISTTRTSYNTIASKYNNVKTTNSVIRTSNTIPDYLLDDRNMALDIIERLRDHVNSYNYVSVGEYYDLIGVESQWTDRNYGWTNLSSISISPYNGGYIINFPPIEEIR